MKKHANAQLLTTRPASVPLPQSNPIPHRPSAPSDLLVCTSTRVPPLFPTGYKSVFLGRLPTPPQGGPIGRRASEVQTYQPKAWHRSRYGIPVLPSDSPKPSGTLRSPNFATLSQSRSNGIQNLQELDGGSHKLRALSAANTGPLPVAARFARMMPRKFSCVFPSAFGDASQHNNGPQTRRPLHAIGPLMT